MNIPDPISKTLLIDVTPPSLAKLVNLYAKAVKFGNETYYISALAPSYEDDTIKVLLTLKQCCGLDPIESIEALATTIVDFETGKVIATGEAI